MEQALQVFNFQDQRVRTIIIDGEIWFVAADVCKVLAIVNSRDALSRLDEDEKGVAITDTLGGKQSLNIVNESGLYHLIFQSRKEQARRFRKWVTEQVLPCIRKTGSYSLEQAVPPPAIKAEPDLNNLWEKRLKLFARYNTIPDGFWCIFGFVAGHCHMAEFRDERLVENALPDGSIGIMWAKHLRANGYDMSLVLKYRHRYPDHRGEQWANLYPNAWLGDFWTWFHGFYLKVHWSKYLDEHRLPLPAPEALKQLPYRQEQQ